MGLASLSTFGLRIIVKEQATESITNLAKKFKMLNRVTKNGFNEIGEAISKGGLKGKLAMGTAGIVANELRENLNRLADSAARAFGKMTRAAADFEQEMAMFQVISGATVDSLESLKIKILEVTAPLPTSATQVARASTAFARMGLAAETSSENLIHLASEAVMFGRAIKTTDEQAAMFMGKLAQWLNVTDKSAKNLGRIASMATRLGWTIKGTTQDVIKATERFGAFVRAMGATEAETLALAGLVVDSGILIRRGSTAINRSFQLMASNMAGFGAAMKKMKMVASPDEFQKLFATSPVKAFDMVLKALAKTGGVQATVMLKSLGLHGNYISDLITMSRNAGKLESSTKLLNEESRKMGGPLSANRKAFESYTGTLNATIKALKGAWENFMIIMASPLLGAFKGILDAIVWVMTAIMSTGLGRFMLQSVGVIFAAATAWLVYTKAATSAKLAMAALKWAGLKTFAAWLPGFALLLAKIAAVAIALALLAHLYNWIMGSTNSFEDTVNDLGASAKNVTSKLLGVEDIGGSLAKVGASSLPGGLSVRAAEVGGAAAGGVFTTPTPVFLGEKAPEVAMTLPDFLGAMEMQATKIAEAIAGGGGGGDGGQINISTPVTLDGQLIAESVASVHDLNSFRRGEIT